ncbi:molybdopterin-dependent oxidoreductase [Aestuariibacter sp. AA17]|uniref:Molybdopterin-dependent oxidoreductase n=1 Tax=Fluctibacter corallii TaxID=2984329 RepID=A0ABT3A9M8_9ALTE|nr:molybdopterin cofactor-binding domain-containing protein [Aestuariibacter sp. AA17]MCV2885389.1 molybdopterin-dependent oxidoreductase [Aestuariibacter sp. AA17]
MKNLTSLDRRRFLKLTGLAGGALVLGATTPLSMPVWASDNADSTRLNLFVSILEDNTVEIVCHRSEMGQGVRTGVPQIIADELGASWDTIRVVQGLANQAYGSQNTDGSSSVRGVFNTLRKMGSTARTMLEQAAAEKWGVSVSDVEARDSQIVMKDGSRSATFASLAASASKRALPDEKTITLKSKADFSLIGKDVEIVDMDDMLTGNTTFGQDVRLPNMVFASIERCPVTGGKVTSFDKDAAMKVKGVVDVILMPEQAMPALFSPVSGVAVIATNTWSALQGRKALNIKWDLGEHAAHQSGPFHETLKKRVLEKGEVIRSAGNAYSEYDNAARQFEATYTVPYLVHAQMEPVSATAEYKDGKFEIWACTQAPQRAQRVVSEFFELEREDVNVHVTLLGGGFGRKSKPDYVVEAAYLAKKAQRPVKVVWSREDDMQHGYYHAVSAMHYQAGMSDKGVDSWIQRTAFPSISFTFTGTTDSPQTGELSLGFGDMPFSVKHLSCEKNKAEGHTRIGWMRSVSNIHHAFAQGSFVDELAHENQQDPLSMWLSLLGDDRIVDVKSQGFEYSNYQAPLEEQPIDTKRLKHAIKLVVEKSGADKPTKKGEGWGISVHRSFVSYVAVATKVKVEDGKVIVLEMHSTIDAGTVVNPDRVKAQQEGSMVFGLSLALMGEITFTDGAVDQSNYHDYQILRMNQCPRIYTYIIENDEPPGGVGEPGTPPVAASLANAIFNASGKRIRDLPISKHYQV